MSESLSSLLVDAITRAGDRAAFYAGDEPYGYAWLDDKSRRAALGFSTMGIRPGDRVAIWLPNLPEWPALYFGLARLGAIAVLVNTRFRSSEVQDIVGRTRAKALILAPRFRAIDFAGILSAVDPSALGHLRWVVTVGSDDRVLPGRDHFTGDEVMAAPPATFDQATPETPVAIFTTSGTTKAPKFVLHSHGSLTNHARAVARVFGYDRDDAVLLQALPYCGTFGLAQALAGIAGAQPSVLLPTFDAPVAATAVNHHRVTDFNATDDMAARLLDAAPPGQRPFPSLRTVGYARFNPALADLARRGDRLGIRFRGLYGMSEVQALFAYQPADAPTKRRETAGGIATSPDAAIRIRDPETGRVLPPGQSGEIELRGPSLMLRYDGDERSTRHAFTEDGWFRTGDLGQLDAWGGFTFETRMGDVLRLGGFLVNPQEIEAELQRYPGVDGAQIVSIADAGGSKAIGFVTLRSGGTFDEAALIARCKASLAGFKVPVRIFLLDAFPTTTGPNGTKVQRNRLREMAEAWTGPTAAR
ncbi:MAG: AMP-binding protein [Alphaproteobacteria bacterium]|nr:AMP-binding protein [Alphaproteobacteria bacterium]